MDEALWLGIVRGLGTFAVALVALPVVAWFEGLRGSRTEAAAGVVSRGPRGALTALATAIKLLEKRAPRTLDADRLLHAVAPVLGLVPTVAVIAVVPLTPGDPVAAPLPFVLALSLFSTGAIALAGVGGGNRLALHTALRLVALRLSVLVVVALGALGSALAAGSLGLPEILAAQARPLVGALPRWGAFLDAPGFAAAVLAFAIHAQRVVRARTVPSLSEPWHGEATGPVLLGHRMFESLDLLASAALIAVLFLGGSHLPWLDDAGAVVTVVKLAGALALIVAVRNLLPTLTPGVGVRLCWTALAPLAALGVGVVWLLR
ncbi:MAG: NADH-quinone oxidoreductase subunit H [Deltaproteobacteria bacterium]|nr:NADH-quinone oxidoreductase subunit H [Deltaproteobacteria bacterium]